MGQVEKEKLNRLKKTMNSLVSRLDDETDRSWLVAAFISLQIANDLGYEKDKFTRSQKDERDNSLKTCLKYGLQSLSAPRATVTHEYWKAGYFFNNALLRIVALTEIGLKALFEKQTNVQPPNDYWWLVEWYKRTNDNSLSYLNKARKQVNRFKHKLRDAQREPYLESMQDGICAFEELISLMKTLIKQRNP
jgi:hypothetical protein